MKKLIKEVVKKLTTKTTGTPMPEEVVATGTVCMNCDDSGRACSVCKFGDMV